MLDENWLE